MEQGGILKWAKANADAPAREKVRTQTVLAPGPLPGTLQTPFPKISRDDYRKSTEGSGIFKRVEKTKPESVSLDSLVSPQKTVNAERLQQHIEDPDLVGKGTRAPGHGGLVDHPVVVRVNGQNVIHDGNHRATAAVLRGEKSIKARVVDLDAQGFKPQAR